MTPSGPLGPLHQTTEYNEIIDRGKDAISGFDHGQISFCQVSSVKVFCISVFFAPVLTDEKTQCLLLRTVDHFCHAHLEALLALITMM